MRFHVALVVCQLVAATSVVAQVSPEWRIDRPPIEAWRASSPGGGIPRIEIRCTVPNLGFGEIDVDLLWGTENATAPSGAVDLRVGDDGPKLVLSPVHSDRLFPMHRWSGIGEAGPTALQPLLDRLTGPTPFVVSSPGGRSLRIQGEGNDLEATVLRCAPAVIEMRARSRRIRDASALVTLWHDRNSRCRGGSGDNPQTHIACAERTELDERLAQVGQCYGRNGEAGYQMRWHRCGPNSVRSQQ